MEIDERKFDFEIPENFNEKSNDEQAEFISQTLEQHKKFVQGGYEGYIKPEDFDAKFEEEAQKRADAKAKADAAQKQVLDSAILRVGKEKGQVLFDLLKLSKEDMESEEVIKEKMEEAINKHKTLFESQTPGFGQRIKVEDDSKEETKKLRRFAQN